MAEHFLDSAQVRAALEQVCRERVSQDMRRHALAQPGEPGRALDDRPRTHPGQGRAAGVQEHEAVSVALVEARADLARVQRHGAQRAPAHGHDALLRSLAEHARKPLLVQNVLQLQAHELGHPGARRVRKFKQRPVADRERLVRIGCREQAVDLGDRQDRRQAAPLPR